MKFKFEEKGGEVGDIGGGRGNGDVEGMGDGGIWGVEVDRRKEEKWDVVMGERGGWCRNGDWLLYCLRRS